MKTLGGSLFVYNGEKMDYCFRESIQNLLEFCDQVSVVTFTDDIPVSDPRLVVKVLPVDQWNDFKGKGKLPHFADIARDGLKTDWHFCLQADEIVHEDSFPVIRRAIEQEDVEAFLVTRHNLWGSPYTMLNVPQNRKPCSTEVIRLAKTQYDSYGDAESQRVPSLSVEFVRDIEIFHMGFVRDRKKMVEKVKYMQDEVFQIAHDTRVDNCEEFEPWRFFQQSDVIPIRKQLPKVIQQWAEARK